MIFFHFMNNPIVSICCVTYNHKDYISECINSFLLQRTDFQVEILIFDDASTDGTQEIIKEFATKHSNIIPFLQNENQRKKQKLGFYDFLFPAAKGKYIAMCDGDDYWTDPLKLQKQIDFLEKNENYSLVFHKVKALVKSSFFEEDEIEGRYQQVYDKSKIAPDDLLEQGNFIHMCSAVFRNMNLGFPFEFYRSPVRDFLLFITLAQRGFLYRIDEYMGVYRRGTGTYSSLSEMEMQKKKIEYHLCVLSYLTEEQQKRIFLEKTIKQIERYEKILAKEKRFGVVQLKKKLYRLSNRIKKLY